MPAHLGLEVIGEAPFDMIIGLLLAAQTVEDEALHGKSLSMLTVLRVAEDSFRELEPILILLLLVTFENSLEQSILFWWKRIFARHCVGCPALPVFNLCKELSTYIQLRLLFFSLV